MLSTTSDVGSVIQSRVTKRYPSVVIRAFCGVVVLFVVCALQPTLGCSCTFAGGGKGVGWSALQCPPPFPGGLGHTVRTISSQKNSNQCDTRSTNRHIDSAFMANPPPPGHTDYVSIAPLKMRSPAVDTREALLTRHQVIRLHPVKSLAMGPPPPKHKTHHIHRDVVAMHMAKVKPKTQRAVAHMSKGSLVPAPSARRDA